jgi:hypothetical protein
VNLDLTGLPSIAGGERWDSDKRMTGRQWNAWLDDNGYVERYGKEKVDPLRAPESALDAPRVPFVVLPDHEPRGLLVHGMDLIFPFGFFMIGLRVLLRTLLLLGGAVSIDIEGGKDEDEDEDEDEAELAEEGAS